MFEKLRRYEPMFLGDCTKFAASKRISVFWVRIFFIVTAFFWGIGLGIYLIIHFRPQTIEDIEGVIQNFTKKSPSTNFSETKSEHLQSSTHNESPPVESFIQSEEKRDTQEKQVNSNFNSQLNLNKMKVTISIDQQAKATMFGLGSTKHSYKLNVLFKLAEKEKKIFNDHPLLQEMIFMEYLQGKRRDIPLNITAKDIYTGRPISMEANSINEMIDFRNEVNSAAEKFVGYIDILSDILGGKEMSYGE